MPPITVIDEAKRKIVIRCEDLAQDFGFTYNRITVRNQKKRWGSCSTHNNINLNIKLVRLPQELMDYVILHELVHTKIKSHGSVFWDELDKYVGESKMLRARLARLEEEKREAEQAVKYRSQAKTGFGSQIRNYFLHPDQRVKDARTGHYMGSFNSVLDGNIQGFLDAYLQWRASGGKPVEPSKDADD